MLRNHSIVPGRGAARLGALALAAALWLGAPAAARADGDFENGFEDQLGRILAFEAVQAGKALLFYGAAPVPVAVAPPPVYYRPPVAYAVPVPVPVPVAVPVAPYPVPYPGYAVVHHHRSVKVVHHHDGRCGHGDRHRGRGDHRDGGYDGRGYDRYARR